MALSVTTATQRAYAMNPWVEFGTAEIPNNGGIPRLRQRGQEYSY
ncbi:hypothetical protein [Microbulbifer sediminum]|nr:hypothetical protein [Microbulbifer sediminum]